MQSCYLISFLSLILLEASLQSDPSDEALDIGVKASDKTFKNSSSDLD